MAGDALALHALDEVRQAVARCIEVRAVDLPDVAAEHDLGAFADAAGDIDREDHKDELGAQKVRITYEKRMTKIAFELWACGTTPGDGSGLAEGAACGLTGYTKYYVNSCTKSPGKGITKWTGELELIDFTTP